MDQHAAAAARHSTLRVLVAEPDGETRRLYIDALRPLGCDAIEASDGREALVEALVRRPSLIVIECRLPLVNGPALCEILRRDALTRTVPIVAIASDTPVHDAERILRAGATSILIKPVAPDALVSELRRLTTSSYEPAPLPPAPAVPDVVPATDKPRRRMANSKTHVRCTTTTPPVVPPSLRCPSCDGALMYERSYVGGVSQRQPEQWDHYVCPGCGAFEYRHRTRKLRELDAHH